MTVAIPADLQPAWVGDSKTREWDTIYADRDYYQRLIAWLRSEGFNENLTHRVEVYLFDGPFAKVWQYVDADGRPQLNEAGDDAESVVRIAPLSSLPPMKEAT